MWHGYLLIESLPPGWTNEQRQQAWGAMRGMGKQDDPSPAKINHSRLRLDDKAMIVEAEFDEAEIAREAVVAMIADALGVQDNAVDAAIAYQIFAEGQTWEDSRQACVAYLTANTIEWDGEEVGGENGG